MSLNLNQHYQRQRGRNGLWGTSLISQYCPKCKKDRQHQGGECLVCREIEEGQRRTEDCWRRYAAERACVDALYEILYRPLAEYDTSPDSTAFDAFYWPPLVEPVNRGWSSHWGGVVPRCRVRFNNRSQVEADRQYHGAVSQNEYDGEAVELLGEMS